ncbi:MAG: aspartate carbamoyltransferase catalytic subunit [Pseudomonadota bacterium]
MSTHHLLDIQSLSTQDIEFLLQRASALKRGAAPRRLNGAIANLFLEPSTRTRVSFELAAKCLALDVVNIEATHSSVSKGESVLDSARTVSAMGVRALVVRQSVAGGVHDLVVGLDDWPVALINAGDGVNQHPSQALLDAALLHDRGLDWSRLRLAIIGDINHSRVARSSIELYRRLGVHEIRLAGPTEWLPNELSAHNVHCVHSVDEAIREVDVVIALRIQRERMQGQPGLDDAAFHATWGLTEARFAQLAEHVLVMHPGPINRGVELAGIVADHARSLILQQVQMGVFMRTAIFEWLLPD